MTQPTVTAAQARDDDARQLLGAREDELLADAASCVRRERDDALALLRCALHATEGWQAAARSMLLLRAAEAGQ
jgi:hypothetical protein